MPGDKCSKVEGRRSKSHGQHITVPLHVPLRLVHLEHNYAQSLNLAD